MADRWWLAIVGVLCLAAQPAPALPPDALESVVSVLPVWPGHQRGAGAAKPGDEPEATAVAIKPGGYLVTALHVVGRDGATDLGCVGTPWAL